MIETIYLGTKGSVVAIDKKTGVEKWRTHLKGSSFTTVLVDDEVIVAHTHGHLFGLDPASGEELWVNELPGLGYGLAVIAAQGSSSQDTLLMMAHSQQKAAQAAN